MGITIEGKTVGVIFSKGDIAVTTTSIMHLEKKNEPAKKRGLVFCEVSPGPVGRPISKKEMILNKSAQVIAVFDTIASIDIVLENLHAIKDAIKKGE